MKKLIIAAAIVSVAVVSQAATVDWSAGMVFNSHQTDMSKYTALDYSWAIVETATAGAADALSYDNGVVSGGSAMKSGVSNVSGFGGISTAGDTGFTADKYYTMLIWQADEKLWGKSNVVLATVDATIEGGGTLEAMTFFNDLDPIMGSMQSLVANQASAVPEPTSGLLLLLGVAGLALRRRRA